MFGKTLFASVALAAASLGAQAQVTVFWAVARGPSCSCPPRRPVRW